MNKVTHYYEGGYFNEIVHKNTIFTIWYLGKYAL